MTTNNPQMPSNNLPIPSNNIPIPSNSLPISSNNLPLQSNVSQLQDKNIILPTFPPSTNRTPDSSPLNVNTSEKEQKNSSSLGLIIGLSVGFCICIIIVIVIIIFVRKRKSRPEFIELPLRQRKIKFGNKANILKINVSKPTSNIEWNQTDPTLRSSVPLKNKSAKNTYQPPNEFLQKMGYSPENIAQRSKLNPNTNFTAFAPSTEPNIPENHPNFGHKTEHNAEILAHVLQQEQISNIRNRGGVNTKATRSKYSNTTKKSALKKMKT
jgi:hypothetical protein